MREDSEFRAIAIQKALVSTDLETVPFSSTLHLKRYQTLVELKENDLLSPLKLETDLYSLF